MSEITALPSAPALPAESAASAPAVDWRQVLSTTEARCALAVLAGICVAFAPFLQKLSGEWFEADSLYSHGPLIPLMAGYIVYEKWPRLRSIPVRGALVGIVPLVLALYVTWFASRTVMMSTLGWMLLVCLAASVLFIGGWRWLVAAVGPILFLVFCLPFWTNIVDRVTQPLQALSTDLAMRILDVSGLHPMRTDVTTVYLNNFHFTVAAACSGAKTTLALLAFACFFILLGRGRWYSAAALLALLLPFSLMMNGLRIALVGIIGDCVSPAAGMAFHDYGAYGLLVVGFLLLGQIARLLGFKQ